MSEDRYSRDEKKDEKDEKEMDKREEKSVEEKWRRDPLGTMVWAVILIWAGIVLILVNNTNLLDGIPTIQRFDVEGWDAPAWLLIFVGAGVILLIQILIRLVMPAYRRPIWGTLFLAILLIGVGLGNAFDWRFFWPLILIFLGLSILFRARR